MTRTELRRLALTVEGKVAENWAAVNDELSEAIDSLREELAADDG